MHTHETITPIKIINILIIKTKRQPMEGRRYLQITYQKKGYYPKSIKNLSNSTPKKQIIQWRNGHKTWVDTSPKKTSICLTDTWKNAQHPSSSWKHKLKPQWDTTSHQSEWLELTIQATTDVGKDAEKEDLFYTAGGNANWCSHSGKQYGGSSKN